MSEFYMTDLGILHYSLGFEVYLGDHGICISQNKYMLDMLKIFKISNFKTTTTSIDTNKKLCINDGTSKIEERFFKIIVGKLMYLKHTRLDIAFFVSMISRFMHCLSSHHLLAAKIILKYIFGTMDLGIHYHKVHNFNLVGYSDSDLAGSCDDRKSTSGYAFNLASGTVAWTSKKQEMTTLSSLEVEYISVSCAIQQAIWMRRIMKELNCIPSSPIVIFCDN